MIPSENLQKFHNNLTGSIPNGLGQLARLEDTSSNGNTLDDGILGDSRANLTTSNVGCAVKRDCFLNTGCSVEDVSKLQ
jgi:hypothetical protein